MRKLFTRDNFWNLMYLLSVMIGGNIVESTKSGFVLFFTVFVLPFIFSRINQVKLNEDGVFVNKQGEKLNDRYPTKFPFVFMSTFAFVPIVGLIIDSKFRDMGFSLGMGLGICLFPMMSYFIFKNCPFNIMFKRKAWVDEVMGFGSGTATLNNNAWMTSSTSSTFPPKSRYEDVTMDLKYMSLSCNVNNTNRWNR